MARWLFVILLLVDSVLCGFLVGQRHARGVAVAGYTLFGPTGAVIVQRLLASPSPSPSFSASSHNQQASIIAWVNGLPNSLSGCLHDAHRVVTARNAPDRGTLLALTAVCARARQAMDAYAVPAQVAALPEVWTLETQYSALTSTPATPHRSARAAAYQSMLSALHNALAHLDTAYDAGYYPGY